MPDSPRPHTDRDRFAHWVYLMVGAVMAHPSSDLVAAYCSNAASLGGLIRRHGIEQTAAFLYAKAHSDDDPRATAFRLLRKHWLDAAGLRALDVVTPPVSPAERRRDMRNAMIAAEFLKRATEAMAGLPLVGNQPAEVPPRIGNITKSPVRRTHLAAAKNSGERRRCDNASIRIDYGIDDHLCIDAKQDLLQVVATTPPMAIPYSKAYERFFRILKANLHACVSNEIALEQRMFIGGGDASALETSLTLDRYGMPMIPGSACKGAALAYARAVVNEQTDDEKRGRLIKQQSKLFGRDFANVKAEGDEAGELVFYDAWWVPASAATPFAQEIVTVHHSKYYSSQGATEATDFDDPIPIPMLAVRGKFCFAVGCHPYAFDGDPAAQKAAAGLGLQLLIRALTEWGIGAKVSSGYGRFVK